MSETERSDTGGKDRDGRDRKASWWPWILVPVGAITLFFVLRYCQQHIPPSGPGAAEAAPAQPVPQ